jgi:GINS complex subunit 4
LVNSYLRMRIKKLILLPYYYQQNLLERQSQPEQRLLLQFISVHERDFQNHVLGKLPSDLVSVLENNNMHEGGDMEYIKDAPPNLCQHVVIRAKTFLPHVLIDDQDPMNPVTEDLNEGDVVLLQYRFVKDFVINKTVDLI